MFGVCRVAQCVVDKPKPGDLAHLWSDIARERPQRASFRSLVPEESKGEEGDENSAENCENGAPEVCQTHTQTHTHTRTNTHTVTMCMGVG